MADFGRLGRGTAIVSMRGLRTVRCSYAELSSLARRFAQELADRGIGKGERVILCGENGSDWVGAFFGCVLQGVLPVPLDTANSETFLKRVEAEVKAALVVVDLTRTAAFAAPRLLLGELSPTITPMEAWQYPPVDRDDALQIVFTSGTTGEPKGIVHTHRNVLASLEPIEEEIAKYLKYERIFHPLRILHTLPLSHVFGQFMGLWIPALLGAEVHFESRLIAADLVREIKARRISVICAVPRVLGLLQQHLRQRFPELPGEVDRAVGISAWARWWRFRRVHRAFGWKCWAFVCGGAALSAELEQFWKRLGFAVVQGYGMTETTALVSLNHPFKAARGTIGQVLPGREVELGPDGEVLVRGETISDTVWQGGSARKREGEWLATGDLAEFDGAGNLRFRSRKKDVIVTAAGLNIYPEDLEGALRQHGARDAAVLETEGHVGPEPFAVLLLAAGADATAVVEAANNQLAEFQRMHRWMVWPQADFPRTSTGKVLKREMEAAALDARAPAEGGSLGLDNLVLDSLGRVELQARLEQRYGIVLDDAAVSQIKNEADVATVVAQRASAEAPRPGAEHAYLRWPWNPIVQAVRATFIRVVAMPLVRFLAAPKIANRERQLPAGPFLIVANHVTSYDVPLILAALPRQLQTRCAAAMSGEMLLDMRRGRNQGNVFLNVLAPFGYWLISTLFNVFPLPQRSGFQRSFQHAGEAIDRGYSVIVFPEGRRSKEGAPQPFMRGAGLLWKQLGVPAVAMRLEGLGELKRAGKGWFRSGKICVGVQRVLPLDGGESADGLAARLEAAVFSSGADE